MERDPDSPWGDLTQELNSEQLLQDVADRIREAVIADLVILFPYVQAKDTFQEFRLSGVLLRPEFQKPSHLTGDDVARLTINYGKSVYAKDSRTLYADLGGVPSARTGNFEQREEIVSTAAVPLRLGDNAVGSLFVNFRKRQSFDTAQKNLIHSLASFAAIAIRNSREFENIALQNAEQFRKAESRGAKLEALHTVSKEIISQPGNPEDVMKAIIKYASELTTAEDGHLDLYLDGQPHRTYLFHKDGAGGYDISLLDPTPEGTFERGIPALVARTKLAYRTRGDAQADHNFKGRKEIHSEIAVPLLTETGELEGVLNVESPREHAFSEEDHLVLEMFAQKAILAIQYARNYSKARREAERFRLLWEASRELSDLTDLTQVEKAKDIVIRKMSEFVEGELVLRRYDENSQALILERVERPHPVAPPPSIPVSEGVNGQVARERRTIVVSNVAAPEPGIAKPATDDPTLRTLAVAPIVLENRYYGNLVLGHDRAGYFEEADIKLLDGLAQQLAITIYRLKDAQDRIDAEHRFNELELFSEFGTSAYELTHRIGNDLGFVKSYVNRVRGELKKLGVEDSSIDRELEKLWQDVSRVLSMSKRLKGKLAGLGPGSKIIRTRERCPVSSLLQDISPSLPALPQNIRMRWELEANLGNVNIVAPQILDILHTMVSNAVEAMPEGGELTIRAYVEDRKLHIDISDTGSGIPETDRAKIFNLFFSTKNSSGFGLWSARRYARANFGELTLDCSSEQGTTFKLILPLAD